MDALTTDQILDIYESLENTDKAMPQLLAEHGIPNLQMTRAANVLVNVGQGRAVAFSIGLALGLQIGAMRLDPIEYNPEDEPKQEHDNCNCMLCQIRRMAEGEDE